MRNGMVERLGWSCRALLAMGMACVVTTAFASNGQQLNHRYSLAYTVPTVAANQVRFDVVVTDNETGEAVFTPRLAMSIGMQGSVETTRDDGTELELRMKNEAGGYTEILLLAKRNDQVLQRTLHTREKIYDGEPLSLRVVGADIRDVLDTFGELTGHTFDVAFDVSGSVTMNVKDVAWDKVLDDLLVDHQLVSEVQGQTIRIRKQ